jgi:hypothetical protein
VTRRGIAGAAALLLLALVLAQQSWTELPRRVRFLAAFAPKEPAVRRLGGSGAAFDRRFFSFLENTRRSLPAGTPGVALAGASGETPLYLAAYVLAPIPVSAGPFDGNGPPSGWITAVYGANPASGYGVLARLPEGVLLRPAR